MGCCSRCLMLAKVSPGQRHTFACAAQRSQRCHRLSVTCLLVSLGRPVSTICYRKISVFRDISLVQRFAEAPEHFTTTNQSH